MPRNSNSPTSNIEPQTIAGKPDWPKNGAVLKGVVHQLEKPVQGNLQWLEVTEFKQKGDSSFVPAPGCWMQFDQGGKLLHETNA
mmetsp:Transcript_15688/g.24364  ORF Transcript_15688/g.24364 Transcript_15688/m.24364 type:complete len:84 (+) Transcript_15688:336-587(+)|eukprot:CAMPEP_0184301614 /NCGR_PEP_ID=MMETSP1049-20130417/11771_1 /TAXON_ID=77928 /ORGANISM="Proteomonas sulcata, Strain CCMP704" /LENGTH=83 /DNA_ID=CAMNT_0026612657 /DNA_START=81 /DNA_END=332 /DNA_ORIENTATION=+